MPAQRSGSLVDIAEGVAKLCSIAPGIGDHPYTELGSAANEVVVVKVCDIAPSCGREIATADEMRVMLDLPRGKVNRQIEDKRIVVTGGSRMRRLAIAECRLPMPP